MRELAAFVAASRKAVVAFIVSVLVGMVAGFGVELPADVVAALTGLLTALTVWAVPNNG